MSTREPAELKFTPIPVADPLPQNALSKGTQDQVSAVAVMAVPMVNPPSAGDFDEEDDPHAGSKVAPTSSRAAR